MINVCIGSTLYWDIMTRKLTLTAALVFGFLALGLMTAGVGSGSALVNEAFAFGGR
jgi:hypothetical protein